MTIPSRGPLTGPPRRLMRLTMLALVFAAGAQVAIQTASADASCRVDLIAGGGNGHGTLAGQVGASFDEATQSWRVAFVTQDGWQVAQTHVDAVCAPEDFPQTKKGNPKVGKFEAGADYNPLVTAAVLDAVADPGNCADGTPTYLAAHAVVKREYREETGWGAGSEFPGDSWATYFSCERIDRGYQFPTLSIPSTATEGQTVLMVATTSPDASCSWAQTMGTTVTIAPDPQHPDDSCRATFVAPTPVTEPTPLEFEVTVTDASVTSTALGQVTVQPDGIFVSAGDDRVAYSGQTVSLHGIGGGSGGSDSFSWTQVSPAAFPVTIDHADTANPEFVAPASLNHDVTLVFELSYSDGVKTATDRVSVQVFPPPSQPAQNAPLFLSGATQMAPLLVVAQPAIEVPGDGDETLVAVASGGDGHYTYLWKYKGAAPVSAPNPSLGDTDGPTLDVTLPAVTEPTTYVFDIEVDDGLGNFHRDTTTLFVEPSPGISPLRVDISPQTASEGPYPVSMTAAGRGGTGPYTYSWVQVGPQSPPGSGTLDPAFEVTLTDPDTANPTFAPPAVDADTDLTFEVTVTDNAGASVVYPGIVVIRNAFAITPPQRLNLLVPPPLQAIEGQTISLGAIASGGTPGYTWTWSCSGGTAPTISGDATRTTLTLIPNAAPETLTCEVQVTDSALTPTSLQGSVQVEVLAGPAPDPLALPAIPQVYVDEGTADVAVTASATGGTGSYSYSWEFVPSLNFDSLPLTDTDRNVVKLDAPQVSASTTLQLRVTVNDGNSSVSRDVFVTVNDITPPLALMSAAQALTAVSGDTVHLGAGQARGGQGPYTYAWTQTSGTPAGTITDANTENPSIIAPAVTQPTPLVFELTVTDAAGGQVTATQTVTVDPGAAAPNPFAISFSAGNGFGSKRGVEYLQPGVTSATLKVNIGANSGQTGTLPINLAFTKGDSSPDIGFTKTGLATQEGDFSLALTIPTVTEDKFATINVTATDSSTPPQVVQKSVRFLILHDGVHCLICGDLDTQVPCDDLALVLGETKVCDPGKPYCMNDIIKIGDQVLEFRRCVDDDTCDNLWYQSTSDNPLCLNFDPAANTGDLTCHLCCWNGDGGVWNHLDEACNLDTIPTRAHLYQP